MCVIERRRILVSCNYTYVVPRRPSWVDMYTNLLEWTVTSTSIWTDRFRSVFALDTSPECLFLGAGQFGQFAYFAARWVPDCPVGAPWGRSYKCYVRDDDKQVPATCRKKSRRNSFGASLAIIYPACDRWTYLHRTLEAVLMNSMNRLSSTGPAHTHAHTHRERERECVKPF